MQLPADQNVEKRQRRRQQEGSQSLQVGAPPRTPKTDLFGNPVSSKEQQDAEMAKWIEELKAQVSPALLAWHLRLEDKKPMQKTAVEKEAGAATSSTSPADKGGV